MRRPVHQDVITDALVALLRGEKPYVPPMDEYKAREWMTEDGLICQDEGGQRGPIVTWIGAEVALTAKGRRLALDAQIESEEA